MTTVADVIRMLEALPPDYTVVVLDPIDGHLPVTYSIHDSAVVQLHGDWDAYLIDEKMKQAKLIVSSDQP